MSFGFGFALPSWQTLSGGFNPSSLFVGGVQGTWYDPSDASTLFEDTAGTTPSPTPGAGALSVVGLMLDKSQGLALGSELVTNGTFTSTSGWTAEPGAGVTLSAANNVLTITQTGGTLYGRAYQALSGLTVGQFYQYTAQVASNPGSLNVQIWAHTGFTGTPAAAQYSAVTSSTGNLVVRFQATATTMYVVMWFNTTAAGSVGFANASVKALPGNHAISYNTTTARPELSARVNLLTYSEQFDNAAWNSLASGAVVTPNTNVAPDGTLTADTIAFTSGGYRYQQTTSPSIPAGQSVIYSAWVWSASKAKIVLRVYDASATDIAFQSVSLTTTPQRISVTLTATGSRTQWYAGFDNRVVVGGDGIAGDVIVWGADLRPTNIGSSVPNYQRIADQYTYDSSGFPRYLVFNGTASGMYTPASIPFATVTSDGQARRNLLNNPTQFDVTASWTQTAVTVTANTAVAPDGTTSGDTIQLGAGTSTKWIGQSASAFAGARTYSFYAKYSTNRYIQFLNNGSAQAWANFDILNGVAGTAGSGVTSSITDAGNGWWRCVITHSIAAATEFRVYGADSNSAAWDASTTSTGAYFLWGAQLETGSTATAFQNIGTDKATVFAGVRKQADPTDAMLAEFSSVFTNAGSFAVAAPWTSTTLRSYFVAVNGNAINSRGYTGYAAPISNVLSAAIKTTAADSDAAQDVRINAADVAGSSIQSAASTGNFGTYPLYIGSRNNASLWFNGYIYSLIVVGAASTAAQISSTESWINVKEGGVI